MIDHDKIKGYNSSFDKSNFSSHFSALIALVGLSGFSYQFEEN